MKPFTINRDSWHYKMNTASQTPKYWEQHHNNFCSYWRATIWNLVLIFLMISVILFIVGGFGYLFWIEPVESALAFSFFALLILVLASIRSAYRKITTKTKDSEVKESLIYQKYRAYKEKICPMIDYK